ncbi:MAG TPA: CTP synthase (glutamine hydrolyzing), partial [Candidatus Hodarchaeales archaeon]|nr:CTP synthase (glutamine hydrolyzing) [Candidatus Hodarchaeales archaeon]
MPSTSEKSTAHSPVSSKLSRLISDDSEFLNFFPDGYVKGRHRFIFVTGGVYSSIGKGIFAGSLAHLLQTFHYNVTCIKMEGYLNIDSGTINPYRHGEVFVLDDGTECDLDLGNYERFLGKNLSKDNFITAGKIYASVMERERQGEYLGRDVLVIPHLTGEIKSLWRKKAHDGRHDFIIVEIGGTAGDYENIIFVEAARQMKFEDGPNSVVFFHVAPIFWSQQSSEFKTKPVQHSVRKLMELGVQPDFIVCRTKSPLPGRAKEKVSLYCNVPMERVIESPDVATTYLLPSVLAKQSLVQLIERRLDFPYRAYDGNFKDPLEQYAHRLLEIKDRISIVIAGKYVQGNTDSYLSISHSLEHAGVANSVLVDVHFANVHDFNVTPPKDHPAFNEVDGIIVPGGFGKRGLEEKILATKFARENRIPYLGLCLGFQMALIEIARNLCGVKKAGTTEANEGIQDPVIYLLPTQNGIQEIGGS